jgi:hypothetical protein
MNFALSDKICIGLCATSARHMRHAQICFSRSALLYHRICCYSDTLHLLLPHLPRAVGLVPRAHFQIFPYNRLAILFAQILVVIIFVNDKRFGLADISERRVEKDTTVGIKGKPKRRHLNTYRATARM